MEKLTKEEKLILYKCNNDFNKVIENYDYLCKYFDNPREEFFKILEILEIDKLDWNFISMHQKLTEDFIREFEDKLDWNFISMHQKLSEDFIREFEDKVNWFCISMYQNLSEDFIREFEDKVNWYCISRYQKLSNEFKKEFNLIWIN